MPTWPFHPLDAKNARCEATNLDKKVNFLPEFDLQTLKTEQPTPASPGIISIEFCASPKPEVDWFWRNMHITDSEKKYERFIEEIGQYRYRCGLKIDSLSNYDAGEYVIIATSALGKSSFSLNLADDHDMHKPCVLKGPHTTYLGDGRYKLEATVWSPQREDITWRKYRNGKEKRIEGEPRIRMTATESNKFIYEICLEIAESTGSDRGTYRLEVTDKNGLLHCDFPLYYDKERPQGRPELFAKPKIVLLRSQNVIMAFCVSTPCQPSYAWILPSGKRVEAEKLTDPKKMNFNHRALKTPDGTETLFEGRLDIYHWHLAEKGFYTCLVENVYGCLEIKFELKTTEPKMDAE